MSIFGRKRDFNASISSNLVIAGNTLSSLFVNADTLRNILFCRSLHKTLLQWFVLKNLSSKLVRNYTPTLFSRF